MHSKNSFCQILPWSISQAIQRVLSFSSKNSTPWKTQCLKSDLTNYLPRYFNYCWIYTRRSLETHFKHAVSNLLDSPAVLPTGACTLLWRDGPSTSHPLPAPRWQAAVTGRADGCQSPRSHSQGSK